MLFSLDSKLIKRLPTDYHGLAADFYKKAQIAGSTWIIRSQDLDFSVIQIINLCNGLHIPLHMLLLSEKEKSKVRTYANCEIFRDNDFVPIYFDYGKFKKAFGKRSVTKNTIANSMIALDCKKKQILQLV